MNKNEFMTYIDENFSIDGSAKRLIRNSMGYPSKMSVFGPFGT